MTGPDGSPGPHVAVVGAGPAGLFLTAALIKDDGAVAVDVFDRLPAPFGLVRYGVAPDHQKIKSVDRVLGRPFATDRVRFIGNVDIGVDITHDDLRNAYDAVVYATGCPLDRHLGIAGEDLPGVHGASSVVSWYSGHPDRAKETFALDTSAVAVVGGGNVALDVARVLLLSPDELAATDVPDDVLRALSSSNISDVHVVVRRGPVEARFGYLELLGLADLPGVAIEVHCDEPIPADVPGEGPEAERIRRCVTQLRAWQAPTAGTPHRRIHFHFHRRPRRVLGGDRVEALELDSAGGVELLRVGMVVGAIGFRPVSIDGLPVDEATGTVVHDRGRVVAPNTAGGGVYVAGWLKRGPQGVIATNKVDANETASSVLDDLGGRRAGPGRLGGLDQVGSIDWAQWRRVDEHEKAAGAARGAPRVKSSRREHMLDVARGVADP